MNKVAVIHTAFEDAPQTVAFVDVPEFPTVIETLEYCYRWTNNLAGSWSKGEILTGDNGETINNGDYNKNVTVMADLPVCVGVTKGSRSTSVNVHVCIANQKSADAGCGYNTKAGDDA